VFATAVACAIGVGIAAAPALASDVVPAATMTALLGSRFPSYDQREGLYSPDHTHILYRGREATPNDISSDQAAYRRGGDYYVLRADGSDVVKLSSVTSVPDSGVKVSLGVWSPDSKRIAFLRDASTRTARDLKTVQMSVLSRTSAGADRWTTTTEGEAVASLAFTPDSRYLVWEERVSAVFTIDTMGLELGTGRFFRLRWRPDPAPSPDPGWTWTADCDAAALLTAALPATAPRLPTVSGTDPQLAVLAALIGPTPACYGPAASAADTGTPLPGPTASPTPSATAQPDPNAPSPTPAPADSATPTPSPTPDTTTPTDSTDTPAPPVRINGPGAGALAPIDAALQSDAVPISESLQATTVQLGGPAITIRAVGKGLRRAKPKRLRVKYTSSGARSITASLLLSATGKTTTLARTAVRKPSAGSAALDLRLSAKARAALKRSGRRTVILRLVGTNPAGVATTVERRIAVG
jgi:hypothetical protein